MSVNLCLPNNFCDCCSSFFCGTDVFLFPCLEEERRDENRESSNSSVLAYKNKNKQKLEFYLPPFLILNKKPTPTSIRPHLFNHAYFKMDDYFSGLLSRHINELRLDNADEQNVEIEEKSEKKEKVENIPEEKESVDYHSSEHSRSLSPSPSPSPPSSMNEKTVQSSSTTTSSTGSNSSSQYVSLRDYQAPQINHERDVPQQLLVALIGREFDEPQLIVSKLNSLIPLLPHGSTVPVLKLIPFTVRRSVLVKANFDWQELKELDLVCMCYNASEARILLTGPDGFYTQLIKKLEAVLGMWY